MKLSLILLLALIVSACTENKKPEEQYINEAKAKYDEKKFDESIVQYREFLKNYPKSDKAIFAYNQIAGIQIDAQKNPQEGIKTYRELAEKFPNTKDAKQALFMTAFIYDETLKDKDNAIKAYQEFLAKYPTDTDPNDKMSESAKTMLEVLQSGRSIEDIIQQNIDKMGGGQQKTDTLSINEKPPKDLNKEDPKVPIQKDKTKATDSETPDDDKK